MKLAMEASGISLKDIVRRLKQIIMAQDENDISSMYDSLHVMQLVGKWAGWEVPKSPEEIQRILDAMRGRR